MVSAASRPGSEEVDHVPFAPEAVGPLHQLNLPAHAIQQAGESQACNASTADQRTHSKMIRTAEAARAMITL